MEGRGGEEAQGVADQGDQIGRIFAQWVFISLSRFCVN
jgi:hypothetical protein